MNSYLDFIGRVVHIQLRILDTGTAGDQTWESREVVVEAITTAVDFIIDIVNLVLQSTEESKNRKLNEWLDANLL